MEAVGKPRVAAVFATMNRVETAVACVNALKRQTHPPNLVVVADNVSSDGTLERLRALEGLPFELIAHPMEKNLGNAGGVEKAISLCFVHDIDAVWILDDDSQPRENALEYLLVEKWNPDIVRHSLQIDPKTGRFTWPLPVKNEKGNWKLTWTKEEIPAGTGIISKAAWTGALISRKIHETVGPVNGALFIRGEDEEYPRRIEEKGFSFEAIPSSILDHPGPAKVIHWHFLDNHLLLEPGLADWKLYYKVRNMVWLKRRQGGRLAALLMAFAYIAGIFWIDGPSRIRVLTWAISDGWRGNLGARFFP